MTKTQKCMGLTLGEVEDFLAQYEEFSKVKTTIRYGRPIEFPWVATGQDRTIDKKEILWGRNNFKSRNPQKFPKLS